MKKRIYQIDLLRFIAALSVLLYHYLFSGPSANYITDINFEEIDEYFKYGYLGVDVFFIISGFVISLSIKKRSITSFLQSRFIRLYPAYWFCVTCTFLVMVLAGSSLQHQVTIKEYLANLTMFQYFINIENIDEVYWTLLVEIKFYILIAFYLVLLKFRKFNITVFAYLWLTASFANIFLEEFYFFKIANFFLIFKWSSYFIAGIFFHELYKSDKKNKFILPLILCLVLSVYYRITSITSLETLYNTSFSPYIISVIISVFFIIMYLISREKLNSINSPKLLKFGVLTYPLYLIHQNIGFILFNQLDEYVNKYLLFFLISSLMLLLAFYINKLIEIPVSKFLKSHTDKLIVLLPSKKK
ncbi:acyltransferase family protein [Aquimarina sp. 2-A2]|uniref:acyltransferase family protein n=1 Tax=Aquimarina sp. 2-A2 TaxID=3382644 RepID=UPI00387F20FA